jgi:hypothetical protein
MDHSILCDDTELRRIGLNDLEFDRSHTTADKECISLPDRSVSYTKGVIRATQTHLIMLTDLQGNKA